MNQYLKNWSKYKKEIHTFFEKRNFLEVETPYLVSSPGMEEYLDAYKVGNNKFLPTSPEFHLKKLLCQGYERIYEIKTCFRNEPASNTHQPEFQMLEWYRANSDLNSIMRDTEDLLHTLISCFKLPKIEGIKKISVREAFKSFFDFDLKPGTSIEVLQAAFRDREIYFDAKDNWNDLFFRVMLDYIEPELEKMGPTFLYDYPPSQSALARIGESGWTQRFEFYWRGLEIANAFGELTDARELRERWDASNEKRKARGAETFPYDEELLQLMENGMPNSGGIALGLERLFMALFAIENINEIKLFPHPK